MRSLAFPPAHPSQYTWQIPTVYPLGGMLGLQQGVIAMPKVKMQWQQSCAVGVAYLARSRCPQDCYKSPECLFAVCRFDVAFPTRRLAAVLPVAILASNT